MDLQHVDAVGHRWEKGVEVEGREKVGPRRTQAEDLKEVRVEPQSAQGSGGSWCVILPRRLSLQSACRVSWILEVVPLKRTSYSMLLWPHNNSISTIF